MNRSLSKILAEQLSRFRAVLTELLRSGSKELLAKIRRFGKVLIGLMCRAGRASPAMMRRFGGELAALMRRARKALARRPLDIDEVRTRVPNEEDPTLRQKFVEIRQWMDEQRIEDMRPKIVRKPVNAPVPELIIKSGALNAFGARIREKKRRTDEPVNESDPSLRSEGPPASLNGDDLRH